MRRSAERWSRESSMTSAAVRATSRSGWRAARSPRSSSASRWRRAQAAAGDRRPSGSTPRRSGSAGEARILLLERKTALTPAPCGELDRPAQEQRHGDAGEDEQQCLAEREGECDHERQGDDHPGAHEPDAHVHGVLEGPAEPEKAELELAVHMIATTPPGRLKTPSLPSPR